VTDKEKKEDSRELASIKEQLLRTARECNQVLIDKGINQKE